MRMQSWIYTRWYFCFARMEYRGQASTNTNNKIKNKPLVLRERQENILGFLFSFYRKT